MRAAQMPQRLSTRSVVLLSILQSEMENLQSLLVDLWSPSFSPESWHRGHVYFVMMRLYLLCYFVFLKTRSELGHRLTTISQKFLVLDNLFECHFLHRDFAILQVNLAGCVVRNNFF